MKSYEGGDVEKLRVFPREERVREFRCPFLECGKAFPRSCDLLFHFMVKVRSPLSEDRREASLVPEVREGLPTTGFAEQACQTVQGLKCRWA